MFGGQGPRVQGGTLAPSLPRGTVGLSSTLHLLSVLFRVNHPTVGSSQDQRGGQDLEPEQHVFSRAAPFRTGTGGVSHLSSLPLVSQSPAVTSASQGGEAHMETPAHKAPFFGVSGQRARITDPREKLHPPSASVPPHEPCPAP